ncbi:MAG: phosphate/phosphite/phosphonate ABC transporter substrate-binding protein [bacterium]|nr:phosphate/phosphite/phosphonate ABC transporter substrate-binding protein [bacterium]
MTDYLPETYTGFRSAGAAGLARSYVRKGRAISIPASAGRRRLSARYTTAVMTLWLTTALLVSACGRVANTVPYVDLTQRQALHAAATEIQPLRMAVAAVLSPEGNIDNYAGLARYIGDHLGRPVELVQRRTYVEVNDLIAAGSVDLAFVCTSAYVAASDRGEMELLVVPEVNSERVYYSSVIVPVASSAVAFTDLRGGAFAFTDPISNTGRVYPTYLVEQHGHTPATFFSSSFFTYSHDKAIEAVADGVADGAAVDSLVLDHAFARDAGLRDRVRVIHRSPPFGIPPVVVPSGLSVDLRHELERLLLGLTESSAGMAILAEIGVDRFVIGSDDEYDSVRLLVEATGIDS